MARFSVSNIRFKSGRIGGLVTWAEVNKAPESDEKCGLRRPRIRRRKFRIRLAGSYNQQGLQQNLKPECDGWHKRVWLRHGRFASRAKLKMGD